MKFKAIVMNVLLSFVLVGIALLPIKDSGESFSSLGASSALAKEGSDFAPSGDRQISTATQQGHKVIAYYFHGTARCRTCHKIEAYTQEAIQTRFSESLKKGDLDWRVVNVDESGNEHFVNDYQLFTKAVVLVDTQNGKQVRWKNLSKVWEFVGDKEAFFKYIQGEVSAYLGEMG